MSYRPHAFGLKLPTGAVNGKPSFHFIGTLYLCGLPSRRSLAAASHFSSSDWSITFAAFSVDSSSSPHQNRVVVPARQAYSRSASVGRRYVRPSFFPSQRQNSWASSHVTLSTGCSSPCFQPTCFQVYPGLPYSNPRSSTL